MFATGVGVAVPALFWFEAVKGGLSRRQAPAA
jgi:hypothetical protein